MIVRFCALRPAGGSPVPRGVRYWVEKHRVNDFTSIQQRRRQQQQEEQEQEQGGSSRSGGSNSSSNGSSSCRRNRTTVDNAEGIPSQSRFAR